VLGGIIKHMKSRFVSIISAITFSVLLLQLFSPTAIANVQNFRFRSFEADYYLSKDDEGRSKMRVVETLVAEFPDFNQNKGLVRDIPISYQGRPLSLSFVSLKRNGQPEPIYENTIVNNRRRISTGTDDYVLGTQTYEFVYEVRDVTRDFEEYHELFWNVNGLDWAQQFGVVRANLYLEGETKDLFNGELTCFQGEAESREACEFEARDDVLTFETTRPMNPGENLSFVVGFEPDSFEPYQEGVAGVVRSALAIISFALSLFAAVFAIRLKLSSRDHPGRGVIVPEYLAPRDKSVMLASFIDSSQKVINKSIAAQVLQLAVLKKVKIIEIEKKGKFGSTSYELELVDKSDLLPEAQEVVDVFFGSSAEPGARYQLRRSDDRVARQVSSMQSRIKSRVISSGYRRKVSNVWLPYVLSALSIVVGIGLVIHMQTIGLVSFDWRTIPVATSILSIIIVVIAIGSGLKPLTEEGREFYDYLKGLVMYMKLAEAERLRYLQSPKGAEKTQIDSNDKEQVIKLYEKLLPYAVLYGLEKDWFKVIGDYYESQGNNPYWYAGAGAFSSRSFSSAVNSISTTTISTSSSGFSGGGGSGGGGGGGGGGGR
jgi:uncharacterized membrane protein YgcG